MIDYPPVRRDRLARRAGRAVYIRLWSWVLIISASAIDPDRCTHDGASPSCWGCRLARIS